MALSIRRFSYPKVDDTNPAIRLPRAVPRIEIALYMPPVFLGAVSIHKTVLDTEK